MAADAPFDRVAAVAHAAGAAHYVFAGRQFERDMIERRRRGLPRYDRAVVAGVAVEEMQRAAVIDVAEAERVDQEVVAGLEIGGVEVDVCDLARPVGLVGGVLVVGGVADHGEIAAFRIGEAEAVAAAGARQRVRRVALAAGLRHLLVQRVDDVLAGNIEGEAADCEALRGRVDGQDMVERAGAAEIDRAVMALHFGEIPHALVERRRALRLAHIDVDAAHAAHGDFHFPYPLQAFGRHVISKIRPRTNPLFVRYRQARVEKPEVTLPLMYLPLIIFSATMSLWVENTERK